MASKKSVNEWEGVFKHYDKDSSGSLDICELRDLLRSNDSSLTDTQIAEAFVFFDGPTGDRKLTLEEFSGGMKKLLDLVKVVTELFKLADKDNSGSLDKDELRPMLLQLYPNLAEDEITRVFNDADKDKNGKITLDEFLSACT